MSLITAAFTTTVTATHNVTKIVTSTSSPSSTARAAAQGGVFEGLDPTVWQPSNPIFLFVIQATIVIALTRILHWPLSKLNQPRVIAEVITGILLGPSVMGRIPGFTHHIFPTASMPAFNLAATLGLVLFLFLVGLEVDLRFLISNWRIALSVSAAGMALPFGLGVAVAYGLYHEFGNEKDIVPISFGIYALFIGVALAITAFPVLCRILTSLNLLSTPVGVIVLSAGVGNDVVGWILLALCVALVNSRAGITALWIFLASIGYALFLSLAARPMFVWVLRQTGSLSNGPTQTVVALTIFLVLASSFFTGIIGIHPIFGAFMVGLICPHEGGFAIKLTEKVEDLVSVLFLPLYFAMSGLSTNLGLLDSGIIWGYVVAVTVIAFFGKIAGGTLASRLNGLVWRESFAVGCLMSCKGLVELIVLNIGLQAKILSTRTFTIFVVMALVTTFATTPLTVWLYPAWYREKLELWKMGKIDWEGNQLVSDDNHNERCDDKLDVVQNLLVYLRADGLSSLFSVIGLFAGGQSKDSKPDALAITKTNPKQTQANSPQLASFQASEELSSFDKPLHIRGLRLMELTERNSSVMKVAEIEEFATRDPLIKAFGSSVHNTAREVTMSAQIVVIQTYQFADTLVQKASQTKTDLILLPWSETGSLAELHGSFDQVNHIAHSDPFNNGPFASFVTEVFDQAVFTSAVGIFMDKSLIKREDTSTATISSPSSFRPDMALSRTRTGLSMSSAFGETGVVFRSADSRGRKQVRLFYAGTADDLYAAKLAIQLAKTGFVDVKIVQACLESTFQGSSKSISKLTARYELEDLKKTIPADVLDHITFEQSQVPSFDDLVLGQLLLSNDLHKLGEVTVLVGRNLLTRLTNGDVSVNTEVEVNKRYPLGLTAATLISKAKEMEVEISLLVVQAKASSHFEDTRLRKSSMHSADSS